MKKGFASSVIFHAIILIAVLIGMPSVKPFEIQPSEPITVEITNIGDTTKLKAQTKTPDKPADKPAPKAADKIEKTKPPEKVEAEKKLAKAEPAKTDPPPKPEPKPDPKPDPAPTPEPKPEPKPDKVDPPPPDQNALSNLLEADQKAIDEQRKKDEAKKKAEEKKKKAEEAKKLADQKKAEEKKKRKLDMAALEDMLNKENDQAADTLEKKDTSGSPEQANQDVQGQDDALSATLADQMRQKLNECWDKPPGSIGSGVRVVMTWHMDQNGNVVDQPMATGGTRDNTFYNVTARSALSAIMQCQPFDFLPKDKFDLWSEFEVAFDPR